MGVLLVCDAPGCFASTPGLARQGKVAAPAPWWMQKARDETMIVACCEEHFVAAMKKAMAA
jgi:hypothetical protein